MKMWFIVSCLVLTSLCSHAAEPPWEYRVVSQASLQKSISEEQMKEWTRANRPEAYERFFGEKKSDKDTDSTSEGGLGAAIAALAEAVTEPRILALDYCLNSMGKEGWELITMTDNILVFKRKAAPLK